MSEAKYDEFKSEIDRMAQELETTGSVVRHKVNETEEQLPLSMKSCDTTHNFA